MIFAGSLQSIGYNITIFRRKRLIIVKDILLNKIANKTLRCGVVGLGYVGLPLAVDKAKAGFTTIGFDVQQSKVDMVNSGHL